VGVTDLVPWLLAQLDKVEHSAQYAAQYGRKMRMTSKSATLALAYVEAERRIVELHGGNQYGVCETCMDPSPHAAGDVGGADWPCLTLRLLASPYADRDGYDPAWAPDTP
jgi:hypothetical protein